MTEQIGLALLVGPEPSCHRLGGGIFTVDAMNDAVDLQGRERPVDRRARRFDRVALARKVFRDSPAHRQAGPARRKSLADAPDEGGARFYLDYEHARAVQPPMPGHDGRVAPS